MEIKCSRLKRNAVQVLALALFMCSSITIFYAPGISRYGNDLKMTPHNVFRRSRTHPRFLLERQTETSSYWEDHIGTAEKIVRWSETSTEVNFLKSAQNYSLQIGLLNFPRTGFSAWESLTGGQYPMVLDLEPVPRSLEWSKLFPEWIHEEEQWHKPQCPTLPMPLLEGGLKLDMVVGKVPCADKEGSKLRDARYLQLLLAAARTAVDTAIGNTTYVVIFSKCRPYIGLFRCSELVEHYGDIWLYKIDLTKMRKRLALPIGSCELAIPAKVGEEIQGASREQGSRHEAYATILHSAENYVCGAIALAHSIRQSGSKRDLVIMVDRHIHFEHRVGLQKAGWKIREVKRIRNPKANDSAYNRWNYSKFRLWQLVEYEKIVFLDADSIVLKNLDFLFDLPEISATGNHDHLFNSGVMVVEPSNCTFQLLMSHINKIDSYNGGDQGYLNEFYPWWHRLPKRMNYLKLFLRNDTTDTQEKESMFGANPSALYVLHYLGIKPWLCYKDYDCNWNRKALHRFASDIAHAQWWKVHDEMPEDFQRQCYLSQKFKLRLEMDQRKAERDGYDDEHWKTRILDPRLQLVHYFRT
ncbi:hypothetical protein O6H91_01G069700 [Diphasiastrum complanatum]|uniref:Uncharacterized protein n=1 Tax=Diphasiastrum complanatum TaxID=34168 RepID=A0ACC2ES32_DIPCM|nr:hypothetical protein O6H91_01G069700 [Diphasiastrum complanatum]